MREILIEVAFDWNAGSLNRMLGDDLPLSLKLYPLQHAFVREPNPGPGQPMWPTQLEVDDQLSFRIFDITRAEEVPSRRRPTPTRFEAYFQHPQRPETPHDIFLDQAGPILIDRFLPREERLSHAFGYFEKETATRGCFPAWDLGPATEPIYRVKPKEVALERAFMSLLLEVEHGEERRVYVLDPEVNIGPYGGSSLPGEPSDSTQGKP